MAPSRARPARAGSLVITHRAKLAHRALVKWRGIMIKSIVAGVGGTIGVVIAVIALCVLCLIIGYMLA